MPVAAAFIRIFAALLLSIPFFFLATHYLVAKAADQTLLDAEFVADSFDRSGLYQRIYGEVFIRPQYADWTDGLIGGLPASEQEKVQLLEEVLPPPYIRRETERNVAELTGFLRDGNDDLDLYVDLRPPLERAGPASLTFLERRIGALETVPVASTDELAQQTAHFLAEVAAGRFPQQAPSAEALTPEERVLAYRQATAILEERGAVAPAALERLEASEPEILSAVGEGDLPRALRQAGRIVAEPRVEAAIDGVRARADQQGRLDLIEQVALNSDRTQAQVYQDARVLRFLVQITTGAVAQWTALILAALCLVLVAAVFIPYWKHVVLWPSLILLTLGLLMLLTAVSTWLDSAYWSPVVCKDGVQDTCGLTVDIAHHMAAGIAGVFADLALRITIAGSVGILAALVISRFVGRKWS
jgi:hypothetical protein